MKGSHYFLFSTDLFSDEDTEVAIFTVDFCANSHESEKVDSESHAPSHQLPVTKVVKKTTAVLQQL